RHSSMLVQQRENLLQRQEGQGRTGRARLILSVLAQLIGLQSVAVGPPELGHAKSGVHSHPVQRTTRDVNFQGQIGRRGTFQAEVSEVLDPEGVVEIKTSIRLKAALPLAAAQGG